jgi:hypothetical protein
VEVEGDYAVRVKVQEKCALERRRNCVLHLAGTSGKLLVICTCHTCIYHHILVASRSLLPIHARESGEVDLDFNSGFVLLRPSSATTALLFLWTGNGTYDLSVAHLEVAGSVCCSLRAHLGLEPAQLVPSAAIQAQMR